MEVLIMFIELDLQSDIPIYIQLKNEILRGIAIGEIKQGETLPSVRQLAEDLGINMHTVNKSYNILKLDGFILIHRKKGVVVNIDKLPDANKKYVHNLKKELRPLITEAYCRKLKNEDFNEICNEIYNELYGGVKS
jgi:DNA-binding transcriptional regulator YhcF (GntR family)